MHPVLRVGDQVGRLRLSRPPRALPAHLSTGIKPWSEALATWFSGPHAGLLRVGTSPVHWVGQGRPLQ